MKEKMERALVGAQIKINGVKERVLTKVGFGETGSDGLRTIGTIVAAIAVIALGISIIAIIVNQGDTAKSTVSSKFSDLWKLIK